MSSHFDVKVRLTGVEARQLDELADAWTQLSAAQGNGYSFSGGDVIRSLVRTAWTNMSNALPIPGVGRSD